MQPYDIIMVLLSYCIIMQINLEATDQHAVQAYGHDQIQINSILYSRSLIVSRTEIITDIEINSIKSLKDDYVELLLQLNPELVIIGHQELGQFPPMEIIVKLSQHRIGIECMSIGAACRTYNVLLSEQRAVVGGFIFP